MTGRDRAEQAKEALRGVRSVLVALALEEGLHDHPGVRDGLVALLVADGLLDDIIRAGQRRRASRRPGGPQMTGLEQELPGA